MPWRGAGCPDARRSSGDLFYERDADSAAALTHCQTFGARFAARFFALLTPTRCTVYGAPDAAVQQALAGLHPAVLGQAAGFHR